MKNWGTVLLLLAAMIITGCFKENGDKTKPVISLKGNAVEEISSGTSYVDAGVTAIDNADGDISANVSKSLYLGDEKVASIDVTTSGAYTIKYNVTDKAGNKAEEVVRSIRVNKNEIPNIAASVQASAGMGITVTANSTAVQYKEFEVQGTVSGNIPKVKVLIDNLYQLPYNRLITVVNGTYSLKFRFSSSGARKITVIGCTSSGEEIIGMRKEQSVTVTSAGITGTISIDKNITTVSKNEMFKITGTLSTNIKKVFITADDIFYLHPENDYVSISNAGTANARYTYYRPFDEAGTRKINVWGCDTNGNVIAVSEQFLLTVSASENKNGMSVSFSPVTGITTNTNVNISVSLPVSGISRIKLLADNKYLFSDESVISNPHKANRIFDTASDDKIIHAYGYDVNGNVMIASPVYHLIVTKGTTVEPTPPADNGNSQFESPLRSVKYYIGETFKLRVKVKPDTKKGVVLAYYCPQNNGVYNEKNFDQNFPFYKSDCKNGYYEEQVSLRENRDEGYYIFVLKEYTDDTNYEITDSLVSLYFAKRKILPTPTVNLTSPINKTVYKKGDNLKVTATGTNNDHITVLMEKINTEDEAMSNSQDWLGGLQKGNSYSKDKILANVGRYRITATGRNTANETDIGSIKVSSSAIEIEVGIPATSKYGDVDGNGIVSENDGKILLEYVVGKRVLTDSQKNAAEVTGDGEIDVGDAVAIMQYIAEKRTQFPIELLKVRINSFEKEFYLANEIFSVSGTAISGISYVKIVSPLNGKEWTIVDKVAVTNGKYSANINFDTIGQGRIIKVIGYDTTNKEIGSAATTVAIVPPAPVFGNIQPNKNAIFSEESKIKFTATTSNSHHIYASYSSVDSNIKESLGSPQAGTNYTTEAALKAGKYTVTYEARNTEFETDKGTVKVTTTVAFEVGKKAKANGYGDIDGNGILSDNDAQMIQRSVVKLISLNETQKKNADVTGDGKISSGDATQILRYIAGLITEFPVEAPVKINDVGSTPFEIGENFTLSGTVLPIVKKVKITVDGKYPMYEGFLPAMDGKFSCTKEITNAGDRNFIVEGFSEDNVSIGEAKKTIKFTNKPEPKLTIDKPQYSIYFQGETITISGKINNVKYLKITAKENNDTKAEIVFEKTFTNYENNTFTTTMALIRSGNFTVSVECRNTDIIKTGTLSANDSFSIFVDDRMNMLENITSYEQFKNGLIKMGYNHYEGYPLPSNKKWYSYLDLFKERPKLRRGIENENADMAMKAALLNRIYSALGAEMYISDNIKNYFDYRTEAARHTFNNLGIFDTTVTPNKVNAAVDSEMDGSEWAHLVYLIKEFGTKSESDRNTYKTARKNEYMAKLKALANPKVSISVANEDNLYVGDTITVVTTGVNVNHVALNDGSIRGNWSENKYNRLMPISPFKKEIIYNKEGKYPLVATGNVMAPNTIGGETEAFTKQINVKKPTAKWDYPKQANGQYHIGNIVKWKTAELNIISDGCTDLAVDIIKNGISVGQENITTQNGNVKFSYKFTDLGEYTLKLTGARGFVKIAEDTIKINVIEEFRALGDRYKKIEMKEYGMYILVTHASNIGMLATPDGINDDKYKNFTGVNGSYFLVEKITTIKPLRKMTVEDNKELYKGLTDTLNGKIFDGSGAVNDTASPTLVYDKISGECTIQFVTQKEEIRVTDINQSWAIGGIASFTVDNTGQVKTSGTFDIKNPTVFFRNFRYGGQNKTFYAFDSNNNVYLIVYEKKTKNPTDGEFYILGDFISNLEKTLGVKIIDGIISDGSGSSTMKEQYKYIVYDQDGVLDSIARKVPSMVYIKQSNVKTGFWAVFEYYENGKKILKSTSIYTPQTWEGRLTISREFKDVFNERKSGIIYYYENEKIYDTETVNFN